MAYANNVYAQAYKHMTEKVATMYSEKMPMDERENIVNSAMNFLKACPPEAIIHDYKGSGQVTSHDEIQYLERFKVRHNI